MKTIKLNDGNLIPQFGTGVFQVPDGKETLDVVKNALNLGIRHIDTAHAYQNERSVGKAVKESGIVRKEIWITTKLWPSEYGEGVTSQAIDKMLKRLDMDYVDLLLLHQQFGDYLGAWKDMEKAVKDGCVKSIGLSNFLNPTAWKKSWNRPLFIRLFCRWNVTRTINKKNLKKGSLSTAPSLKVGTLSAMAIKASSKSRYLRALLKSTTKPTCKSFCVGTYKKEPLSSRVR